MRLFAASLYVYLQSIWKNLNSSNICVLLTQNLCLIFNGISVYLFVEVLE